MDIQGVAKIDTIVLTGLDYSMKPEHVRFESSRGYIKPFPEIKVMHLIKSLAVMVYTQEKLTPYYHGNVCDGRNSLAYFICAVHRQTAPQPMTKTHSRQNSNDSGKSDISSTSCKSAKPGKHCELPKLSTTSMLPLGYWDSLYYALVAEIRSLRDDLERRFGFACEIDNPIFHHYGPDGETKQAVTAIDFAVMLETAWYALMDTRLVATLDDAVRMRYLREGVANREVDSAVQQSITAVKTDQATNAENVTMQDSAGPVWPPPIPTGLVDICGMEPEAINDMLWSEHVPAINRACLEDFEDESMLTAYRAELHAREIEAAIAAGSPLPSASFCPCHRTCVCKLKCEKDTELCTCLNGRAQIYHLVREQESKKQDIHTEYVKADQNVRNQFLGAATNTLAQLQIAAMADPTAVNVKACRTIHDANKVQELHVARKHRERSHTNESRLAYVPGPKTPVRGPKDVYPLNFYSEYSPQRYPRMHRQPSTSRAVSQQASIERIPTQTHLPSRKPVPAPIITGSAPYGPTYPPTGYHRAAPTPPSSTSYFTHTLMQAGQVTYPSMPISQSHATLTQSFSGANSNDYGAVNSTMQSNLPSIQQNYHEPTNEYVGLLARHPSTLEHSASEHVSFPPMSRPPPIPVTFKPATTNAIPTVKTLSTLRDRPQPILPAPDFMAPKPAQKQRYVSAGGHAKVSERAEIPGPVFTSSAPAGGGQISKEELNAKMSDPEWVRRNFGEAAVSVSNALFTTPRGSAESSKHGSGRKSGESDCSKDGDQRDRTSSSASSKVAKLMHMFSSRKNSQGEADR